MDPAPPIESTPPPRAARPRRRWRLLGGLFFFVGAVALLLGLAVVIAAVYVRTPGGQQKLTELILHYAAPKHGTLTIGAFETDIFSHVAATDITLVREDGAIVGHVDRLDLDLRLGGLVGGVLLQPRLAIQGVDLTLSETDAGLDIAAMWDDGVPSTGPWRGLGIDLVYPDVAILDTTVTYARANGESYTIADATVHAAVELRGAAVLVHDLSIEAPEARVSKPAPEPEGVGVLLETPDASTGLADDPLSPGGGTPPFVVSPLGTVSLAGSARWDPTTFWIDHLWAAVGPQNVAIQGGIGRLDGEEPTVGFGLSQLHVDVPALAPITGELPVVGAFDAHGTIAGLLAAPRVMLEVTTPGGDAHAEGSIDTRLSPPTWSVSAALNDVDVHAFIPTLPAPSVLRGLATAEGTGVRWPDELTGKASFNLVSPQLDTLRELSADGTVRLVAGVLTVERVAARGPGVNLRTGATIDLVGQTGTSTNTVAGLDVHLLEKVGVDDLLGHLDFSGDTTFGWGDHLGVTARGTVAGAGVGLGGLGTAKLVAGPVDASWSPELGARAEVDLVLGGLEAQGFAAGTGAADLVVTVDPRSTVGIDGTASVGTLTGPDIRGERVDVEVRLDRRADGHLDGFVDATTTAIAWREYGSDTGTAKVHFGKDVAAIDVALLDGGRTVVGVDAEIDLVARSLRARELLVAPTEALAWRADGIQTVRLVEGGVADVRVKLVSGDAYITLDGFGRKKDLINLRLEARGVQLGSLDELLGGRFTGYRGDIAVRASMEGHASRPTLFVDLDAKGLTIPEVIDGVDVDAQAQAGDRRMHVEGSLQTSARVDPRLPAEERRPAARLATIDADFPFSLAIDAPGLVTEGDVDVRVVLPPADTLAWNSVLTAELPELRSSAELHLTGPILDPKLAVVATVDLPTGTGEWVRFDVDADTIDGKLHARVVGRERYERRAEVQGIVELFLGKVARSLAGLDAACDLTDPDTWMAALELDLVPLRLPVQVLAPFVAGFPPKLTGDLVGGVHVSGTLHDPKVEGALLLASGQLGDLKLSPAMVTMAPEVGAAGEGYHVDVNLGFGAGASALIAGFVPFDPSIDGDLRAELDRPGLALDVKANQIPLTAVSAAWPQMEAYAGLMAANGSVRGSVTDPTPSIEFSLKDGDFVLYPTGVHYKEAGFTGRLGRDELRVDDLSTRTFRRRRVDSDIIDPTVGRITGNVIARRVGDRPAIDGQLRFDRAWLMDVQNRVLRTNGVLDLADQNEHLQVIGEMSVTEGSLILPERFFSAQSDLALDGDIEVIRAGAVRTSAERRAEGIALPTWLDAEITVDLARNTFLDATVPMEQFVAEELSGLSTVSVDTQLDGEVLASVHDGQLSLVGVVNPLRGTARVMGLPFNLPEGGSIAFTGKDYTNPVLDLRAERTSSEYGPIIASITGTPSALQLSFSSETLSQDDVLAVLILGKPLSEAGNGGALLGLAASLLSREVVGTRSRAFDVFELDSNGDLRVGRRLRDNVFLVGEAKFGGFGKDLSSYAAEITLEVQLDRYWQFDFTTGTTGVATAGLNRKWRF